MTKHPEDAYFDGYDDGRIAVVIGGVEAAWGQVRERRSRGTAYGIGFRQAIWDHEDANGLPHSSPTLVRSGAVRPVGAA